MIDRLCGTESAGSYVIKTPIGPEIRPVSPETSPEVNSC